MCSRKDVVSFTSMPGIGEVKFLCESLVKFYSKSYKTQRKTRKPSGERKASKSKKRHFARASSAKPHEINYFIELAARSLAATLQSRHMYAPNPRSLEFLSRSSDN